MTKYAPICTSCQTFTNPFAYRFRLFEFSSGMGERRNSDGALRRMESYPLHSFSLGNGSTSPVSPLARPRVNDTAVCYTSTMGTVGTMGQAIGQIFEKLDGLAQLHKSISEVQASIHLLQGSVLFQGKVLEEVRCIVSPGSQGGTRSFDLSQDFGSEQVAAVPSEDPPLLPIVPGQVEGVQESHGPQNGPSGNSSLVGSNNKSVRSVRFDKSAGPRKKKLLRKPSPLIRSSHASTINDLEAATAQELLGLGGKKRTSSKISESTAKHSQGSAPGASNENLVRDTSLVVNAEEATLPKSSNQSHRATLAADKEGVLKMCRRLSLDELQTSHDAHIARTQAAEVSVGTSVKRPMPTLDTDADSMVCAARFWLLFVGILGFRNAKAGLLWFIAISLPLLAQIACLVYFNATGKADFYRTGITLCLMLGSTIASWSMRRAEIHLLLGHEDGGLEEYARKSGFLKDWRRISRRRLLEVLSVLMMMLSCRWLGDVFTEPSLESIIIAVCFSSTAVGCAAVSYTQLHIVAGMDLAVDSFCINFFREMDLEQALNEWNTVQATLRQVSTKLSRSMLALGASCGASLILLAEYTFFHTDSSIFVDQLQPGVQMAFFLGWLFPPVLLFLYSMMRAAGVTEKASRVAPLVNSWHFGEQEEDVPSWMDLGRQYIVQYIIQSEAGFYVQGVRLHAFQVTKLSYYFAAFIFAVLSKATNNAQQL